MHTWETSCFRVSYALDSQPKGKRTRTWNELSNTPRRHPCKCHAHNDPDGHPKLLHLWPPKLLQAGRSDGDYTGVTVMREAASFKR